MQQKCVCVSLEVLIIIKGKRPLEHCVWHREGPWCEEFIAMAPVGLLSAKLPGLGCCPTWQGPLALRFSHGQGAKSTALCRTFHYHHSFTSKRITVMNSTGPDELQLQSISANDHLGPKNRNAVLQKCSDTARLLSYMMPIAQQVMNLDLKLR